MSPTRPAATKLGLLIALGVLIADQTSKLWVVFKVMDPPQVIEVFPFFNLVMAWNRGVSFGMFNSNSGFGPWVFFALSLTISLFLAVWLWKSETKLLGLALGMIIGGAIGSAIDRVHFGAVADFLDFYVGNWHWPAFNIADCGITIGAGILILDSILDGLNRGDLSEGDEKHKKGTEECR